MKILIDARPLQTYSRFRGIGRYVNLLIDVFGDNNDFSFLFFKQKNIEINVKNKVFMNSPKRGITFTDNFFLPQIFKKNNIDVYHSTAYALPGKTKNVKYIFTLHDVSPLKFPQYCSKKNLFLFKKVIKSAQKADKIIAVSERSKKDLIDYINIPENNISVIHHALNIVKKQYIDTNETIENVPGEYVFYVGGVDGIKNVETILKALNKLDFPLVIAGAIAEDKKKNLLNFIDEKKREKVFFIGYVSDETLQVLYKKAKLFVFPSLYEGFGFPPLEAIINGTPSVVSTCGAIPEVLEDAALYLDDPLDYQDLSEKISLLWNDDNLRNEILKRGNKILKKYSFDIFESKMKEIYFDSNLI